MASFQSDFARISTKSVPFISTHMRLILPSPRNQALVATKKELKREKQKGGGGGMKTYCKPPTTLQNFSACAVGSSPGSK